MRQWLDLGVHAGLSTSNTNFSTAEMATEIRTDKIQQLPLSPCARIVPSTTHQMLEEFDFTIRT
jgi:hypothetical protein